MLYWFLWQLPWHSPCVLKFNPCLFSLSITVNVILSVKAMHNLSSSISLCNPLLSCLSFICTLTYLLKNDSHSAKNYISRLVSLVSFLCLHTDHNHPHQPVSMFDQPFSEEGIWKMKIIMKHFTLPAVAMITLGLCPNHFPVLGFWQ